MKPLPVGLLLLLSSQPAVAQIVRGRVIDAVSGMPLSGARVTVRGAGDSTGLSVVTGDDGAFALRVSGAGQYRVEVRRLGFGPAAHGPFELVRGQVLGVDVELQHVPFRLDSVTVVGDPNSRMLERVGWYVRQRSDFGHFITRAEIERHHVSRFSDLLMTIPGVTMVADARRPGHVRVRMRGSELAFGGLCEPRVFVDGIIVLRGGSRATVRQPGSTPGTETEDVFEDPRTPEPSLDDIIVPEVIEAIEVYRTASQVPPEFGGSGVFTRCGVVVIWTRRGR